MMSCKGASEAELIVWCVKNGNKEDVIRSKYSEALDDPRYCALIGKDANMSIEDERYISEQLPVVSSWREN